MRGIHLTRPRATSMWRPPGHGIVRRGRSRHPEIVVIDLADVLVLDPTAVTALIHLRRRLQSHEGFLLLRGASPHLQTMLAVTGLDRAFPQTFPRHQTGPDCPDPDTDRGVLTTVAEQVSGQVRHLLGRDDLTCTVSRQVASHITRRTRDR